jgi:formate dehydrogenase subunit gamma
MAATTHPPEPAADAPPIARFTRAERCAHWVNAALFAVVMLTGAAMYIDSLALLVGHRLVVRTVHTYTGLAIPVVFLVALLPRWGRALRADLGRLNRWAADDRRWFRRRAEPGAAPVRLGKFNPGQKLNAAFLLGATVVMLASGSIMHWYEPFSDALRRGATFTHDWFALFIWVAVLGHVLLAFQDPDALRGMLHGRVPARWARTKRPAWYEEVTGTPAAGGESPGESPPNSTGGGAPGPQ